MINNYKKFIKINKLHLDVQVVNSQDQSIKIYFIICFIIFFFNFFSKMNKESLVK